MQRFTLFLLLASGAANAGVVTIDAANFAAGTDLTNATPGITLVNYSNYDVASGVMSYKVYAVPLNPGGLDAGPGAIGNYEPVPMDFNFGNSNDAHLCFQGNCYDGLQNQNHKFNALLMTFSVPTNLIELRVHFDSGWIDAMKLRLYNAQRQLIVTCYVPGDSSSAPRYIAAGPYSLPCGEIVRAYDCVGLHCRYEKKVRVTRSIPDVAFAIWGGGRPLDSGVGVLTKITFRQFSDCAP